MSGFSGESTLGEDFTPRCEEKWPIKVPIFEGGPSIHRGTLKKCSSNCINILLLIPEKSSVKSTIKSSQVSSQV